MIAARRFSSGIWINVEELTKELGVSRTPIRQAMKQLEAEGLVTHIHHRGIRMAEMTLEMARDLYQVREVLEGLAAVLATEKISAEALAGLRKILVEQSAIIKKKDLLRYSISDFKFHQVIYDSCDNPLLKEQLEQIKGRSRPLVCDITAILGELYQDHQDLVQALKVRDPLEAKQVMTRHNQRMRGLIEKAQSDLKWSQPFHRSPAANQ
jgi:DNA-binding GntR family transcriptional regulator